MGETVADLDRAIMAGERMTVTAKAQAYLGAGRVRVVRIGRHNGKLDTVDALVKGRATDPYAVSYDSAFGPGETSGWACNCPARVPWCAHIVAVALVTGPGAAVAPFLTGAWQWAEEL